MPTYEYECEECRYKVEVKKDINAPPLSRCPECEGKVRRVIHASPFFFKAKTHPDHPGLRQAPEGHWVKEGG